MIYILIRWAILAIAIGVTAWLLPGMTIQGNFWVSLIIISAVYGLVNAIIRPIIMFLSCPLIILTLGLFTLIANALMLSLTNWFLPNLLTIDSFFWTTVIASLIISIVSGFLNVFVYSRGSEVSYLQ
ncbi:MAG TPA: phage holin family protein [Anaerolineae bacterium]|nr:phage holin family protein [Anaerolineae bacterium]